MVIDTNIGLSENTEKFEPQMRGIVELVSTSYWRIIGTDGKTYHFSFQTCIDGADTFNDLKDGIRVLFNKANRTEQQELNRGLLAVNVALDTSEEVNALVPQTETAVANVLGWASESAQFLVTDSAVIPTMDYSRWSSKIPTSIENVANELSDDEKMINRLNNLQEKLEPALKIYSEQYRQDYRNIQGLLMTINHGMLEWLYTDIIDLQALFSILHGRELSPEDVDFFRGIQMRVMDQTPEIQASILWFFELVNDYTVSKSNDITIRTNPLKNILFWEKDISYEQWISGMVEGFEKNEAGMISLGESIRNAEAPQVGLKQFIRELFDTKPEVMDEEDRVWLQVFYTQWPDENVTNKPNTISKDDRIKRDQIAKKYVFEHSEMGKTSEEAKKVAQNFRDSIKK